MMQQQSSVSSTANMTAETLSAKKNKADAALLTKVRRAYEVFQKEIERTPKRSKFTPEERQQRAQSKLDLKLAKAEQVHAEAFRKADAWAQKAQTRRPARQRVTRPKSIVTQTRYRNAIMQFDFRVQPKGSYSEQVRRICEDLWRQIPDNFKPSKGYLRYDFGFEEGLDPPSERKKVEREREFVYMANAHKKQAKLADEKLDSSYISHSMTGISSAAMEPNGERIGDKVPGFRINSLQDILDAGEKHIHDRLLLEEYYDSEALNPDENGRVLPSGYRRPRHLSFTIHSLKLDPYEEYGDKTSWLLRDVLDQNDCAPGDCVFQCMINQFSNDRTPIRDSIQEIRQKCGIGKGGVSLELMGKIEQTYKWKGIGNRSKEQSLGFCVFDSRLNLRRLPPYQEPDKHHKYFCNIVTFNGHAYAYKKESDARDRRRQSLSFFQACIQVGTGLQKGGGTNDQHSELYKQAYKLFLETQHLQPDLDGIREYIDNKFGRDICSQVALHNVTPTQKIWVPKSDIPAKKAFKPPAIKAKGLAVRCKKLGINPNESTAVQARLQEIKDMGPIFPEASFDMENVLSMDIETASVQGRDGLFMTYAVGWCYKDTYTSLVAESESDLETNKVLWRAIEAWCDIAKSLQTDKDKKPLFVYAHNGSRFDAIACIQAILQHGEDVPTDQLCSNGKFISLTYKDLVFRDSCLITASSLKASAQSYGVQASKGYLPHGYLQNCRDTTQILERLNKTITWSELEPYMDWFVEASDSELHTRVKGRSYQDWVKGQKIYKEFDPKKICDFRQEMDLYLKQDVICLHQLVEAVGEAMASKYGADIRQKCTTGSLAEHIWQHTLVKAIPKLATEAQHLKWQRANRGGFCGPLSNFDTVVPEGQQGIKVDVTSLYPSAASWIEFETATGVQKPLEEWYRGFPDPSRGGWKDQDFQGVEMTAEHYEQLSNMHGIIRVSFDQSGLKFPFFLQKMSEGNWSTLAPVLRGEEYYTIPQVRMAFHHGVKMQLHDCEYTDHSREPYREYMDIFAKLKNDADGVIAENKPKLKSATGGEKERLQGLITKANFDRTLAKLFLNGLLGRNNMKIERPQTLVTKSANDVISLLGDGLAFKNADIEQFSAGDASFLRAKFREGDYGDHIEKFNVAPYLSGYMLGYSKMLMQASFQYIAEIGATACYTDTDSIGLYGTPEQIELYTNRFVAKTKTLGSMEIEDHFTRLVSVGPKKYCTIETNGDYHWNANGIPAKANAHVDVLQRFESVLTGNTEIVDYFSITAGSDFNLSHTTDAKKNLRFICLKGRVEDGKIHWWQSEDEFKAHARTLKPIGFEEKQAENQKGVKKIDKKQPKVLKEQPIGPQRVYVLHCPEDNDSYVGYTNDVERRLLQHNGILAGGASRTAGKQWVLYAVYAGFRAWPDRSAERTALSFEATMMSNAVGSYSEWPQVAGSIINNIKRFEGVHRIL